MRNKLSKKIDLDDEQSSVRDGENTMFKRSALSLAMVAAAFPQGYAIAQDKRVALEEVVVTATKRSLNLQDVGQSIVAFTGEDIRKMGIRGMSDYVNALPSVTLNATTPGRNQLVMRGVSTGSNEYRTDSQVAVYLDELAMTTNSQQVSVRTIDMERIENLPGPQGTLFGSSSQTGTLRLITNKPNFEDSSGKIEASLGTTKGGEESYDLNGFVNLPLVSDKLALRAVAYTSKDGGYVDNVLGSSPAGNFDNSDVAEDDSNEYTTLGGRVALSWNVSDNWHALLNFIGEDNKADGTWETDPFLGDHKITRFYDEFRDDRWWTAGLTLNGDVGFADLTVSMSHFDREIAYEWDNVVYNHSKDRYYGGGLYNELYAAGDPSYANYSNIGLYDTGYLRSSIVNDQTQKRDTIELRLSSKGDSRLQWMIGGYYESVQDDWFYFTRVPGFADSRSFATAQAYAAYYAYSLPNVTYPIAPTDISYSNTLDRKVDQTAVFGELGYDLTDKLTVTAGARWAKFERDEVEVNQFPQGLAPAGSHDTNGRYGAAGTDDDVIYKLGVQYQIDDDRMVYGLFSQGFRLGGLNSQRAAATGIIPLEYQPDFLDNYEIGLKSQWLDDRVQLNVSVFHMQWEDFQVDAGGFGPWWLRGKTNGNGAETTGVEATAGWQVNENLKISASLFLADAEFSDDYTFPDGDELLAGMPMPGSPDEKAWASVNYTVPDVLGGDMWFYYDIAYSSETWNGTGDIIDNNTNGLAESWTYSNFSMGLDLPSQLSIALQIDNLFDQATYSYIATGSNGDADTFNDPRYHDLRSIDRPRTAWLVISKRF